MNKMMVSVLFLATSSVFCADKVQKEIEAFREKYGTAARATRTLSDEEFFKSHVAVEEARQAAENNSALSTPVQSPQIVRIKKAHQYKGLEIPSTTTVRFNTRKPSPKMRVVQASTVAVVAKRLDFTTPDCQ